MNKSFLDCPSCGGSGRAPLQEAGKPPKQCSRCGGHGKVVVRQSSGGNVKESRILQES